ncbi:MAG TPA: hypothetical protein VFS30_09335 [Dehalococcoidia bacterium]|nr:hypothetical protein [Dehalococcoidia bacterium]
MKRKISTLALGLLATTAIAIGALGSATGAAADPETDSAQIDLAIAAGDDTRLPTWLRYSIIACAADTIHVHVATVKAGLRAGHSLSEIAARYGVREPALERGILECERHFLWRLVETDKLNRAQFYRLMYFLTTHIDRIVNYHYSPSDPALSDAATDVAVTDAVSD